MFPIYDMYNLALYIQPKFKMLEFFFNLYDNLISVTII